MTGGNELEYIVFGTHETESLNSVSGSVGKVIKAQGSTRQAKIISKTQANIFSPKVR